MPYNKWKVITTVYLGLGSNLGDRESHLQEALEKLSEQPTIQIQRVSSLYETAPVGWMEQPDFLNLVAEIETTLEPQALLAVILNLENQMGRTRTFRWGPRVIDIDVLLYGDRVIEEPGLTVPHPRLLERAFTVVPLAEIAPGLRLPGDGRTPAELAKNFSAKTFQERGTFGKGASSKKKS